MTTFAVYAAAAFFIGGATGAAAAPIIKQSPAPLLLRQMWFAARY